MRNIRQVATVIIAPLAFSSIALAQLFTSTATNLPASTLATSSSCSDCRNFTANEGLLPWAKHDRIVIAHAVFGYLTFLIVLPAGILLARLGRHLTYWLRAHYILQSFLALPMTLITFALGCTAVSEVRSGSFNASHKIIGLTLSLLLLVQILLGLLSHQPDPALWNYVHILVGLSIIVLGYAEVQTGLNLFRASFGRYTPQVVEYVVWLLIALESTVYLSFIMFGLIHSRPRKRKNRNRNGLSSSGLRKL